MVYQRCHGFEEDKRLGWHSIPFWRSDGIDHRISIFGHIARFENDVSAHMALRRHIDRPPPRLDTISWSTSRSSAGLDISISPVEL